MLPNGIEIVELMFGAAKANVPLVPINPALSPSEAQVILDDCDAALIVGTANSIDQYAGEVRPETLLVTAGSGGRPVPGVDL